MYSFFKCSNHIHLFIFSLLGLNPVKLHLRADLGACFLRQDFNSARVREVPARYMYIIQPLIPAINLKHKVPCQRQNIPHRSEAAGGAAWRMRRSHGRRARALPSLSFDKLALPKPPGAVGSGEIQPHSSDSPPHQSHRNIGLRLLFLSVGSCQENYFSSFASFLFLSILSETVAHWRAQLPFTYAAVEGRKMGVETATTVLGVNLVFMCSSKAEEPLLVNLVMFVMVMVRNTMTT